MNIWQLFTDTLQTIQKEMHVSIQLKETRRGPLFPKGDLNTGEVLFNTKLHALVALYNHMMLHPESGCESVSLYTLYNIYFDTCRYDEADETLTHLEETLSTLRPTAHGKSEPLTAQSIELQVVFILLHECAHMLFHADRGYRTQILQQVRERIEALQINPADIPDRIKKYMESFIPTGIPRVLQKLIKQEMQEKIQEHAEQLFDYSSYLDPSNDAILEEFGCDQVACGLALHGFITLNPAQDAVLEAAIELFMALFILDYDYCLQSIYRGKCQERMVELPRLAGTRHGSLRGFISDIFLQYGARDVARQFRRQAEVRDEGVKRLMFAGLFDHLSDLAIVQHTVEGKAQRSRALQLESRFAAIEVEILRTLGCQPTWSSI